MIIAAYLLKVVSAVWPMSIDHVGLFTKAILHLDSYSITYSVSYKTGYYLSTVEASFNTCLSISLNASKDFNGQHFVHRFHF